MERETLLEKYLHGELTAKERSEFDALLNSDADFKEEVQFHTDLKSVTEAEDDDQFREMLSDFESKARMEKPSVKRFPVKWLVAASILLVVGLTYFFTIDPSVSTQDLFVSNFEPYRNVVHPVTRGEDATDTKTEAFSSYQTKDYKTALSLFTKLYTDTQEPYYLFYRANALIELNRAEEAIPLLQEHLGTEDSLVKNSRWYLAMAYLKLDDLENTKRMLREVVRNAAYKTEEAQKLLDALE